MNVAKVLELLDGISEEKRTARFMCSICVANPTEVLIETEGSCQGIITEKESGTNGFGYDPVFYSEQLSKTLAQAGSKEKNSISHRGNAIRTLKPLLEKLLLQK